MWIYKVLPLAVSVIVFCFYVVFIIKKGQASNSAESLPLGNVLDEEGGKMGAKLIDKGVPVLRVGGMIASGIIFFLVANYIGIPDGIESIEDFCAIASLVVGFVAVTYGLFLTNGVYEATCPYCNYKSEIFKGAHKLKCRVCDKTSVQNGDYLVRLK